jgi:hypothetical protein
MSLLLHSCQKQICVEPRQLTRRQNDSKWYTGQNNVAYLGKEQAYVLELEIAFLTLLSNRNTLNLKGCDNGVLLQ